MIDRDKVYKGLQNCIDGDRCYSDQCPYYDEGTNIQGCTRRLAEDALALLKELENRPVVIQNGQNNKHIVNHGSVTMTFGK